MNLNIEEVGKLTKAAHELMSIGFTPSQVAYVFRDVVDEVVTSGETEVMTRVETAVTTKANKLGNGFSMADDAGYCYLRLVKAAKRADVAQELRKDPSVGRFLTLEKCDLDTVALRKYTFVKTAGGGYHVRQLSEGESTAGDYIAATVLSLNSDATPMYHAYRRHQRCVKPLDVHMTIGGGNSRDCVVDKQSYLYELWKREGKVLAVADLNVVRESLSDVNALAVVCPQSLKSYVTALCKYASVLTPEELRISTDTWDVVVVTSGVASDLIAMQARLKLALNHAKYLVCYTVIGSPAHSHQVLAFISSLPPAKSFRSCGCKLFFRLPDFNINEHTVIGGYLSGEYTSLERAVECSSGVIGKCVFVTTPPVDASLMRISVTDSAVHGLCDISTDEEKVGRHNSVFLSITDSLLLTESVRRTIMFSFRDTLYVNVQNGHCTQFVTSLLSALTTLGVYTGTIVMNQEYGLLHEHTHLLGFPTGDLEFGKLARRVCSDICVPFVDSSCGDVGFILSTAQSIRLGDRVLRIKGATTRGEIYSVTFSDFDFMVFTGKYRFVVVVPSIPVAVIDDGNWYYAKPCRPFVIQRGTLFAFNALHDECKLYVAGVKHEAWIKTSGSRLLGVTSGCWASGGLCYGGSVPLGLSTPIGGGCAEHVMDVPPGCTLFEPVVHGACVVNRMEGDGDIALSGAYMTSRSNKLCIKGGFDMVKNYGSETVKLKVTVIHNEYEFDCGGPSDDDFSDAVDETFY